jgi:DNA invertase Pin-like site-specific DNA recombinase
LPEKVIAGLSARVSLEEQAEKFGLPSQLRALRDFAYQKKYDTSNDHEFVDDEYSGLDVDRPALDRLRALIRLRCVDVVVA